MAYAAVLSLRYTISILLHSTTSITRRILNSAYMNVIELHLSLQEYNIRNNSQGVMDLDTRIRDEVYKFEDTIESHVSSQFLNQEEEMSVNLDHLREDIHRFSNTIAKMEEDYTKELNKPPLEEEEATAFPLETDHSGENESDMVGLSDQFLRIRKDLIENDIPENNAFITGMAGIGKTKLAKKIYSDPLVKESFKSRAFVRVGQKFMFRRILQAIVDQVNLDNNIVVMKGDEGLEMYFRRCLTGRKYLIVLDDLWDFKFYHDLKKLLPQHQSNNGSMILVTSREVPLERPYTSFIYTYFMQFLSPEESWDLLKREVFANEEECPIQLVKVGKKIAKNCEGLPLLILSVAQLLSKAEKIQEYWDEVANEQSSVFKDALDQIIEVLSTSYYNIPQYLKVSFLYMASFPPKCIIPRSKLLKLFLAEGFDEFSFNKALDELSNRSLVLRISTSSGGKACILHCAYRHLSRREAESNNFLLTLNTTHADCSTKLLLLHRRLAIHNNVLFAIKEVNNTISSIPALRSLLCTGSYHQYQVPIYLESKLLRILDAITIRFYEFPAEVGKLILLRYLAFTSNSNLPSSIFKLWNLRYLIVHQALSIVRDIADSSYVPSEMWDLKELKHVQIVGRNLPDPPRGRVLDKLVQLLDVGVQSCTKKVLKSIPNLKKLRIQIELEPDAALISSLFDHISCLRELESLQIVIMNPIFCEPLLPPPPLLISLHYLRKLTLSGLGYPWKDMNKIAELACLRTLKLQCYAFQGDKWEASGIIFSNLQYLYIEDTDLVKWTAEDETFIFLVSLSLKNCYNLEEIPPFQLRPLIKLVDCNPSAETYAKKIHGVNVSASYSWK